MFSVILDNKIAMDKVKKNAQRNLFGVADAAQIEAECAAVMKLEKERFVQRWGFDPDKMKKMTKLQNNILCSAASIKEMKEGDFLLINSKS